MSLISILTAICAAMLATVLFNMAKTQEWVEQMRSSHLHPANTGATAPQIGGLIVIPASLAVTIIAWLMAGEAFFGFDIAILLGTAILCLTGFIDDRNKLDVKPRLVIQILVSIALCLSFLPYAPALQSSYASSYPLILSSGWLIIGVLVLIWSINSINFIDGSDLGLVSGILPGALLVGLIYPALSPVVVNDNLLSVLVSGLFGSLLVFSFFNKPAAKFYLGDAGSLPIGFLVGAVILNGLAHDMTISTLMPFTYIFVDTTFTFAKRLLSAKDPFKSHRDHAYQVAGANGFSPAQIALAIFLVSLANTVLAAICMAIRPIFVGQLPFAGACLAISYGLFCWFHRAQRRGKHPTAT